MVLVKSVCIIIFCVLTLAFRSAAEAETPSPEDVLVGSIHTIVVELSKNGEVSERDVFTYDPQGRVIESKNVEYGLDGPGSEKKSRSVYTYDAERKREEMVHYLEDGSVSSRTVRLLDDKGNKTEDIEYLPDGRRRVRLFDDKGNETKDIEYLPDGSRRIRFVYRHDDKGNSVETITYWPDESILAREVYANTYDEQGNLKEWIYDRSDSRKDSERLFTSDHLKMIFTYDEKERISESLFYKADDSLWGKLKYALFKKWTYVLEYKSHYAYDTNGYLSEKTTYDGGGALESKNTYTYEFDSVGNWIKKRFRLWDAKKEDKLEAELLYIYTRTITYYESPNPGE